MREEALEADPSAVESRGRPPQAAADRAFRSAGAQAAAFHAAADAARTAHPRCSTEIAPLSLEETCAYARPSAPDRGRRSGCGVRPRGGNRRSTRAPEVSATHQPARGALAPVRVRRGVAGDRVGDRGRSVRRSGRGDAGGHARKAVPQGFEAPRQAEVGRTLARRGHRSRRRAKGPRWRPRRPLRILAGVSLGAMLLLAVASLGIRPGRDATRAAAADPTPVTTPTQNPSPGSDAPPAAAAGIAPNASASAPPAGT